MNGLFDNAIDKGSGVGSVIGSTGLLSISGLATRPPALNGPNLGSSTHVVDFGVKTPNNQHSMQVTLRSIGSQGLNISGISSQGAGFSLGNLPSLPAVLAPGASLSFDVGFSLSAASPCS